MTVLTGKQKPLVLMKSGEKSTKTASLVVMVQMIIRMMTQMMNQKRQKKSQNAVEVLKIQRKEINNQFIYCYFCS